MSDHALRINNFLARCGIASRRKSEELIKDCRVTVNGETPKSLGYRILPEDEVCIDGKIVQKVDRPSYYVLNKPPQYLCSESDPHRRPLARSLIPDSTRLFHVGRLDYKSQGLIFYSNDGDFTHCILHPSFLVEKEYEVTTRKDFPLSILQKKITFIEGERFCFRFVRKIAPSKVRICLTEGKNREIRRFFDFHHLPVFSLTRTRIGPVTLDSLKGRMYRLLSQEEVDFFLHRVPHKKNIRARK